MKCKKKSMDYATTSETSNSLHHTEQVAKQCQKGKQEIALDGHTAFGMHQSDYSLVQCSEKR